ncbi:MAG: cell division protein FtsZ [Spirochaetales bacterium]
MSDFTIVDEEPQRRTVIKVIGVGGGGSNAVNRMIESGIKDVDFLAANTDSQALGKCLAPVKIALGRNVTKGLGAGGKPDVGAAAAEEDKESIKACLLGADMVFVTAGMGGGTGTGAAPVVARVAKELGALTVAVVTRPFGFEGGRKKKLALEGIEKLMKSVDAIISIPNDKLLNLAGAHAPINEAFLKADDVLRMGVQGISEIITVEGAINVDFGDVKTVMEGRGVVLMGIGRGTGENRAIDAATLSIQNPLLEDVKIDGAQGILVSVIASPDFSMTELGEIMDIVTENTHPDAIIKYGYSLNDNFRDEICVTVIAAGFPNAEEELVAAASSSNYAPRAREVPGDLFGSAARSEATAASARTDNFLRASVRPQPRSPSLVAGGMEQSDLDIPTILRQGHAYSQGN